MVLNAKITESILDAQADLMGTEANGGFFRIYDGTQPASADTAITDQVLLAELGLSNPAFAPASGGVILANAMTPDSDAKATGTASWFRIFASDGVTALWDGSVGTANCNLNINSVSIQQHAEVSITRFDHTVT